MNTLVLAKNITRFAQFPTAVVHREPLHDPNPRITKHQAFCAWPNFFPCRFTFTCKVRKAFAATPSRRSSHSSSLSPSSIQIVTGATQSKADSSICPHCSPARSLRRCRMISASHSILPPCTATEPQAVPSCPNPNSRRNERE